MRRVENSLDKATWQDSAVTSFIDWDFAPALTRSVAKLWISLNSPAAGERHKINKVVKRALFRMEQKSKMKSQAERE
jgi:hypothetical protein